MSYEQLNPVIKHVQSNSGAPGDPFLVVGLNFNQPGLRVEICGNEAEHQLLGDGQTLQIFAPACNSEGFAPMEICNSFGCASRQEGFNYLEIAAGGDFIRGDANGDGVVNVADAIWSLQEIFNNGPAGTCFDSKNFNGDLVYDIGDPIFLITYIFSNGTAPPTPGPINCGNNGEPQDCEIYNSC